MNSRFRRAGVAGGQLSALKLSSTTSPSCLQVFRLGWHPSVALWGGNNEVEASLDWYPETRTQNLTNFQHDYNQLFLSTIGQVLQQVLFTLSGDALHQA